MTRVFDSAGDEASAEGEARLRRGLSRLSSSSASAAGSAISRLPGSVDRAEAESLPGRNPDSFAWGNRQHAVPIESAYERLGVMRPLPGTRVETARGAMHMADEWFGPGHCHGSVRVDRALAVSAASVASIALDEKLAGIDLRRMLFVDTETTGLAGGAGTLPFLVGLGWFEDESLRVQQLFLRRPGEEAPILHHLAERLAASSCIVTYNGKSFDWPLLRTRFIMNRIAAPILPPHLDLLHCVRRVFKRRLGEVRLTRMEEELLGFRREDDVHGSQIPLLYARFLRGETERLLTPVLEHNTMDIVALAALLAVVTERYSTLREEDDPMDHLGYAKVAARANDDVRALSFAEAVIAGGGDPEVTLEALGLIAKVKRRRGDYVGAVKALEDGLLGLSASSDAAGYVRLVLSKLYEHKLKDFARALEHAELCRVEETSLALRRRARLAAKHARAAAILG